MRTGLTSVMVLVLWCCVAVSPACAQKGMGDTDGVARLPVKPAVVSLSGKLLSIRSGPCENTTGWAVSGTHILLETQKGRELNVHLGPTATVGYVTERLSVGKEVKAKAFRTAKMPKHHYVAQTLAVDGKSIRLRDADLRPLWAGGGPTRAGNQPVAPGWGARQQGYGDWQGRGRGRGWRHRSAWGGGYRRGGARFNGPARGPGRGRGGPGNNYAPGYGRGTAW